MQLALLVQVHDMLQSGAITAIGPVHQIIELKSNSEIELDDIIQSGVLETQAPENTHVVYPKLHVLIADQQQINNVVQQFHPNEMYHEVYQLVQNLALIKNY